MKNYYFGMRECPIHPGEYLEFKNLLIITIDNPEGRVYPSFDYCPKENKFANGNNMLTIKEYALKVVNEMMKENYRLDEIKVDIKEEEISKLARKIKNH
jgi:hypothetical protein